MTNFMKGIIVAAVGVAGVAIVATIVDSKKEYAEVKGDDEKPETVADKIKGGMAKAVAFGLKHMDEIQAIGAGISLIAAGIELYTNVHRLFGVSKQMSYIKNIYENLHVAMANQKKINNNLALTYDRIGELMKGGGTV